MNLKSVIHIETTVNDHMFTFEMPMGCSYGDAYHAAFDVLKKVMELSQEAIERAAGTKSASGDEDNGSQE